jgi:MSHA biogenesis protein MshQ
VDNLDGTPATCAGRFVCSNAIAVGRFVPDHFAFTAPAAPPRFRTFDQSCAAGRSFTYIGAPFGYVSGELPAASVEARNFSGNVTTNYRDPSAGGLFKLTAASLVQTYSMTGQTINTSLQTPQLTAVGNGTATYTGNAADTISIARSAAAASAPFNANIELRWVAEDANENAVNQGIITTPTPLLFNGTGSGIAFDGVPAPGNEFRYGRLRLANANGSQLVALPVLMEAQYFNGTIFVTNTADNCTSVAAGSVTMTFSGNLAACETAVTNAGALSAGRRTLVLPAPGAGNDGAADLRANLAAASGNACTAVGGAGPASTSAARPWLQGNWTAAPFDDDPTARATFGTFKGSSEVIFIRENF